jgi:hypothetical protein
LDYGNERRYIERLNATTRLHTRRLTRLTLAFSKKRDCEAAVALHFCVLQLCKMPRYDSLHSSDGGRNRKGFVERWATCGCVMTGQTKKFINLEEIIGLRFCCKNEKCGAELCLPFQNDFTRSRPADKCPNCGAGWLVLTDRSGGSTVAPLLEKIVQEIRSISQWPGQCEITLEIKPDPIPKVTV